MIVKLFGRPLRMREGLVLFPAKADSLRVVGKEDELRDAELCEYTQFYADRSGGRVDH